MAGMAYHNCQVKHMLMKLEERELLCGFCSAACSLLTYHLDISSLPYTPQVKDALKKLEERERAALEGDANKRKFNSLDAAGENVTAEEMEAFRLKKARADDPLTQLEADGAAPKGTGGYDYL